MPRKRIKSPLRKKLKRDRQNYLLKQTPLTLAGPLVNNLVKKAKGETTIAKLESLGKLIARIPVYAVDEKTLQRSYARRPAEQVLRDNSVYKANQSKTGLRIFGCVDHTHVALACLRSMGIESAFIRYQGHSRVLLRLDSDYYYFDPRRFLTYGKPCLVKLDPEKSETFKALLRGGKIVFGEDAKAIGLNFDLMQKKPPVD